MKMSKAEINIYYPFACLYGKSCFPSRFVNQITKEDYLEKIIDAASEYGIEVHPIVAYATLGPDQFKPYKGHGAPEGRAGGHAACPSQESNRELVYNIMSEMIEKYSIKGIHLDYMRYPNMS